MELTQDGKFIFDERRNPFAVTFTAEDAQKIVAACNAHDALVAALKRSMYALNHLTDASDAQQEIAGQVRAALTAAGAA